MKKAAVSVFSPFKLFQLLRSPAAGLALIFFLGGPQQLARAQEPADPKAWRPPAIAHAQKMRIFKDLGIDSQLAPGVIPKFGVDLDSSGLIASFQPDGATFPSLNAFFKNFGTNGRTCFSCHQPQDGWGVSAAGAQIRFALTLGLSPIFRLIDGATCPSDDVSSLEARREAFKLLTRKGLIRIGLPLPAGAEFALTAANVSDPYSCTIAANSNPPAFDPVTGTDPTTGRPLLSMYRRPLPSTGVKFLTEIMWDGRETAFGLANQATDATLIHAEANAGPNPDQLAQIVAFQSGIFTAQFFDLSPKALTLTDLNATGGPKALSQQPFLTSTPPTPVFDLYTPWENLTGTDAVTKARLSVARGEIVFNNPANRCGGCHNTQNVGDRSSGAPFVNLRIANAGGINSPLPPVVDITGLPVFTLTCNQGPLAGQTFVVTDPGRALITGLCADIGAFKVPTLRGLAARAPYFHNGSAATLLDVVNFYNERFTLNLSPEQKDDLVNFLKAL